MSELEGGLKIGEKYTKEEIIKLGLEIRKNAHVGLICRKGDYLYFFDPVDPKGGSGFVYIKFLKD